jgi:hypothetical protein
MMMSGKWRSIKKSTAWRKESVEEYTAYKHDDVQKVVEQGGGEEAESVPCWKSSRDSRLGGCLFPKSIKLSRKVKLKTLM